MNAFLWILLSVALAAIQAFAGGRHLAVSLPSYGLLAVAVLLGWWSARRMEIPRRTSLALLASAVFFGYVLLRAVVSPEAYLARSDLYLVLGSLMVYLLTALNLTSSKLRVRLVLFLLLLASANVAIGAIQFAKGQNFMVFPFLPRTDYGTRASGFYGSPNHLAGFLEVAVLMGLGITCWSRWRPWAKVTLGYFVVMAAAGLVITGSRGGYVSTLAGLLVFGILSLLIVTRRMQKYSGYILIGGAVLAVVLGWSVQRAIREDVALRDRARSAVSMDSTRPLLWQAALKQFESRPVVGTGSGSFLYFGRQFRPEGVQADPVFAHNDYLQFLAEYGAVGIVGLLAFLGVHLKSGWKAFHSKVSRESETLGIGSNSLALSTGALSSVAACIVHSFVDFNMHIPANALVMAFVFGVLANPGGEIKISSKESRGGVRLGRHFRLVAPALALVTLIFALPTLPAEVFAERARLVLSDWRYMESPDVALAAEDFARRGLQYDAKNPELYYYLGESQVAQALQAGDRREKERLYTESSEAYRKAVELAPGDVRLVICLASSLDAVKRFDEAAPLYARAIALDPGSANVHWAHGLHWQLQQRLDEAEAAYRRSLQLGGGMAAQMGLDQVAGLRKGPATPEPAPGADAAQPPASPAVELLAPEQPVPVR